MPCIFNLEALLLVSEFAGVQSTTQLMACSKDTLPEPVVVLSLTRKWFVQLREHAAQIRKDSREQAETLATQHRADLAEEEENTAIRQRILASLFTQREALRTQLLALSAGSPAHLRVFREIMNE